MLIPGQQFFCDVIFFFFPWKPQGLQVSNVLMELIQDQIWLFASNGDDYV